MKFSLVTLASVVVALASGSAAGTSPFVPTQYEVVTGYFQQDDPITNSTTFDIKTTNFGLLPNTTWTQLASEIEKLNDESPDNEAYKLFFLARHGDGYHNAAETFYTTPLWNCYWGLQDGNSTNTWNDALLTPAGVQASVDLGKAWEQQLEYGVPFPQKFYTSPLRRCGDTLNNTFGNIALFDWPYAKPIVKESIREQISIHTCDQRHNMTYIQERYPEFTFECGFSEDDNLWNATEGESDEHVIYRANTFLNDVFANDTSSYISVTSHSGFIRSILSVVNHITFPLSTGQMIPVIIKGTNANRTDYTLTPTISFTYSTVPTCSVNPTATTTSVPTTLTTATACSA